MRFLCYLILLLGIVASWYFVREQRTQLCEKLSTKVLSVGDPIPPFTTKTFKGRSLNGADIAKRKVILNFIGGHCPFCEEQIALISTLSSHLEDSPYQWINVTSSLTQEHMKMMPFADWIEDKEGTLTSLFNVEGYPTLFVIGNRGRVLKKIVGVPEKLTQELLLSIE